MRADEICICVALAAACCILASVQTSPLNSREADARGHDIVVGDVVVHVSGAARRYESKTQSVAPLPADFGALKQGGARITVQANGPADKLIEAARFALTPAPEAYQAPADMPVYIAYTESHYPVGILLKIPHATLFGRPVAVLCNTKPVNAGRRHGRRCLLNARITDRAYLGVVFQDDNLPASSWPELVAALDIVARARITKIP